MSKAKNSLGAKVYIETATPDTYQLVGELTDIPGVLGDKVGKIDVTSFDSDAYKEFISDGLKDAPEFSFKCNYVADDAGQMRVFTLGGTNANTKIKIEFNDQITPATGNPTSIIRSGYVSGIPNIVPGKSAQLVFEFPFQASGAPTVVLAA
ncbi:hypothetical protein [Sulfuricurvum sp.]|uniref:hypothetical protein n=1 Tax=Sulfuricurvum sp. TaxID=2025608 RepID=UPI003BAF21CA